MKKITTSLFLIAVSIAIISGCVGTLRVNTSMGMTVSEFQRNNVGENRVFAEDNIEVYKMY